MIPVKPHVAAGAHVGSLERYRELYHGSIEDPEAFWREQARRLALAVRRGSVLRARAPAEDGCANGARGSAPDEAVDGKQHAEEELVTWWQQVNEEAHGSRRMTTATRWSTATAGQPERTSEDTGRGPKPRRSR
jgi:hypothetical protein